MKNSLYVVMPAYNEEDNIEAAVKDWYKILEGKDKSSRIVIADNGSTDRTHSILEKMKHDFPQLEILSDTEKQHGPKLIALYNKAIADKVDYVFQTDSDGQTNPNEFDDFWCLRDEYDCIIGHRSARGDGKTRAFVEHVVCLLLRIYFGIKVPDANAPFRLMKVDVVKKYITKLPYDYNIPNIMMTTFFAYYKEKMIFREVSFRPRQGGINSVNIPRIIKIGWNALKGFSRFKKEL